MAKSTSSCTAVRQIVAVAIVGLVMVPVASARMTQLPDACGSVPSADVAAAFNSATPPASTEATVRNIQTCSFGSGQLTVSIGYTALGNPAIPVTVKSVPGLPHGEYMTYRGSTQTEIVFYEGSAATGVYCVVRNYAKISKKNLTLIAQAVNAALAGQTGTGAAPGGVHLISG